MPSSGGPANGATIQCLVCAAVLPVDASFCLQCGSRLPDHPPGAGFPDKGLGLTRPHGTILGAAAKAVTAAAEARSTEPAAPSNVGPSKVPNAQRTMMGVPLEAPAGPSGAQPAAPRGAAATLMGVSPQAAAAVAAAQGAAPPPTSGRTMMGVPARRGTPGNAPIPLSDADSTARRRREDAPMIGVSAQPNPTSTPAAAPLAPPSPPRSAPTPAT